MNHGVRKLILLVLFTSSLSTWASWNPLAWPTTNSFRLSPTNYYAATNLYGQRLIDVWVQEAQTTNDPIPKLFDGVKFISSNVINDFNYTTDVSYVGPVGSYTNSTRVFTNTFLKIIEPDVPTNRLWEEWTLVIGGIVEPSSFEAIGTGTNKVNGEDVPVVVTNNLQSTIEGIQTNLALDVDRIWPYDVYMALRERWWLVNNETLSNDYASSAFTMDRIRWGLPNGFANPTRSVSLQNDNLQAMKSVAEDLITYFVDVSYSSNGTFDAYFSSPIGWEWVTYQTYDYTNYGLTCATGGVPTLEVVTNTFWSPARTRNAFPMWTKDRMVLALDLPHTKDVATNMYTITNIPGWFIGDTNLYQTNMSLVLVATNISATWFDWSPERDLGGYLPGLYSVNTGKHVIRPWQLTAPFSGETNVNAIYDSCGEPYVQTYIVWQTNLFGREVTTQVVYQLDRLYTVTTNAGRGYTNEAVTVYSTNYPASPLTIAASWTNPAAVVTNYLTASTTNAITNVVIAAATYTNDVVLTNTFACSFTNIGSGFSSRDYGWWRFKDVLTNMVWQDGGTVIVSSNVYSGYWIGDTCTPIQVDSAPWIHTNKNDFFWPWGFKSAFGITNAANPVSDISLSLCTNEYGGYSCSGTTTYIILDPGCYQVVQEIYVGDTVACGVLPLDPTIDIYTFTTTNRLDAVATFDKCCTPTNFPVDPFINERGSYTYIPAPCFDSPGSTCSDPTNYYYGYSRNSQALLWTNNNNTGFLSVRTPYYKATRGGSLRNHPSPPSTDTNVFEGVLREYFSQYTVSIPTNGVYYEDDFYSALKPFAGDAVTNESFLLEGALLLIQWNNTNAFAY